jgi:hypothetical protein
MGLQELRQDLEERRPAGDPGEFRRFLRSLDVDDRRLFFRLARNRPGPGAYVQYPENHGFIEIDEAGRAVVVEKVLEAPMYRSREAMFESIIALTHRMSQHFSIYIGRSYVRDGAEHTGPLARWRAHAEDKGARYAIVLGRIPTERIEKDELLAIALVRCWSFYQAICCNNTVLASAGRLADVDEQVLYMCLTPR